MDIIGTLKSTACSMIDTVSTVAQNYVERNRTKAKLNRLRMVMKSESELMNRAYIALGKDYYTFLKTGKGEPNESQQKLVKVIDNSKAKIARARECYRGILEKENDVLYNATVGTNDYKAQDVQDITVACSNESDYKSNPFTAAAEAIKQESEEVPSAELKDEEAAADELF